MYSTANDDDMVECPYNKYHRMARKRLQPHLIKCRLSYPDAELCKCPFNASHLIPEPEFTHHVTNCPDKALITQYKYNAIPLKKDEEDRKQLEVECDDNWDDTEAKDYDPKAYVSEANVIRSHIGDLPSVRKVFRKSERKRLGDEDEDSADDEVCGKKIYKDLDCMKKEEDKERYGWYEDLTPAATSRAHGSRNNLSGSSNKRPFKLEGSDDEDARNKKQREEKYHLDDDPYYKSNNSNQYKSARGRGGRGRHYASPRGASRKHFY